MRLVWGWVTGIVDERPRMQRLRVEADGRPGRAICYPSLSGKCAVGDEVLLNTTAVELDLGTGGIHFVVARRGEGGALTDPSGGHIMKLRYTPLQRDVLCVEAQESLHHELVADVDDLGGMPVVCCGLHSQVAVVAAGIKDWRPESVVTYVMTDQGALPMALSDMVAACLDAGLLDSSVTTGQSFGGTYEAITLHSGLLAAQRVAGADVAIVAIGPGIVGSGSVFGHGGVSQGEAINAVSAVGGKPIAVLRLSFADARQRHQGVSHHTLTALSRVALAGAVVPVPGLPEEQATVVEDALAEAGVWKLHERLRVNLVSLPDMRGLRPRSMDRTPDDDPAFFAAAAAAGRAAASMITSAG